jgi:hypothetical protein
VVTYGQKIYEKSGWGSMVFYNKMANGAYDMNVYPMKLTDRDQNRTGVPVSAEPIAFSKILIAASVLGGRLPDAEVEADDKVYAKTCHDLWKRTWAMEGANGSTTLMMVYQYLLTYGWAAWRIYPRRVQVQRRGVNKILFDDIYREPLDPKRTWLGIGTNNGDYWSWGEVYYEKDMPKEDFYMMFPEANKSKATRNKLDYVNVYEDQGSGNNPDIGVSDEARDTNGEKVRTDVTIGYYENVLQNKYIVKCGKMIIYDGELPNDDSYGSVVTARCFVRDHNDPHGVGLYEMMRGNTALYTYINSLNAQQVEAEIFPLLFGAQVQNGTATYKRGPNIVNPKHPGTDIDVIKTSGNVVAGIQYADKQKQDIEDNTGVNNILAGNNAESTLGSTVILKEAAYNRLTIPKNFVVSALEKDAKIATSWINQTYPVDKVFMIDSDDQIAEFVKQNPNYFVESQPIVNELGEVKGYAIAASQNLRLNYDFTPEGEIMENVPTRTISSRNLFNELNNHGHISNFVEFHVDADSMLLPSIEIKKQNFMQLWPSITNQLTLIYSLRNKDPEAAASQLMALEVMLDVQGGDIFDYIMKSDYDAILGKQPSQVQAEMQQKQMEMDAKNSAMQKIAGGEGSGGEITPMGDQMSGAGTNPLSPENPEEVPVPQSTMGAAANASIGRAAANSNQPG